MKKQVRSFEVNYDLDWAYTVELSKLRSDIDAIEKLLLQTFKLKYYDLFND